MLRYQARVARFREQRAPALISNVESSGGGPQSAGHRRHQRTIYCLHVSCAVGVVADDNGKLQPLTHPQGMTPSADMQWRGGVFDKGLPPGAGTNALPVYRTRFCR
ncbi:hypothetical protein ACLBOM_26075 [Escherichia coli]